MKEYEIVAKFYNACAGSSRPQTFFEEAELNDPADYVRQKHGRDFEKFRKEVLANGQIVFSYGPYLLGKLTNRCPAVGVNPQPVGN